MTNGFRKMNKNNVKAEIIVDNVIASQEVLEFNGFMVIPGGRDDYKVELTPSTTITADMMIDFEEISSVENASGVKLKDCARVKISIDGEQVMDCLLADAFEGEAYMQKIKLKERRPIYLDVEFYLPIEIGNEVKNASLDFYLVIKLERTKIMA
jgi:hypothetical protein